MSHSAILSGHYSNDQVWDMYLLPALTTPVEYTHLPAGDLPPLWKSVDGQGLCDFSHACVSIEGFIQSCGQEDMILFTIPEAELITSQLSTTTQAKLIALSIWISVSHQRCGTICFSSALVRSQPDSAYAMTNQLSSYWPQSQKLLPALFGDMRVYERHGLSWLLRCNENRDRTAKIKLKTTQEPSKLRKCVDSC